MQPLLSLLRLGLGGMLLDPQAYRAQRDAPNGLGRGFALVLLVGLLVGVAALVGNLLESLAQPSSAAVVETTYAGIRALPWYQEQVEADPAFAEAFEISFNDAVRNLSIFGGGGLGDRLLLPLLTPVLALLGWLIGGTVAHLAARALGGSATLSQTLSTTALGAGVNLLGLVQIVPFAQVAGTILLGLLASYVAIRETHALSPWRSFWATLIGPLLLVLLGAALGCALFFMIVGIAAAGA